MTIFGVAFLATCTLIGTFTGDYLGKILGVQANVGGVAIAMMLLIAGRLYLTKRNILTKSVIFGVEFWGSLYIPIVVAMAASQNVVSAVKSGPLVIVAATLAVLACFITIGIISKFGGKSETMDEIETRELAEGKRHG